MKFRRLFALLSAVMMSTFALSSCGSESSETSGNTVENNEDPYEVVILNLGNGTDEALNLVSDEMSKITQEKLGNTTVKVMIISQGTYNEQLNLMLSSGEQVDIFNTYNNNLVTLKSASQIIPIDDLLQKYGQDILANIPEKYMAAGKVGSEQYGIPGNRGKGSGIGFFMVKEIADSLNVDVSTVKTYDDIEAVLTKVKENYPDMYPLAPDVGGYNPMPNPYDQCYGYLGCLVNVYDGSTKLVNFYETDEYKEWTTHMYDWMQKGLVMPDGASSTVTNKSLMAAGKAACAIRNTDPLPAAEWTNAVGKEVVVSELLTPYETYAATQHAGWQSAISVTSEKPERAMQVLNLMMTDADFMNLLTYGVEGVHYQYKDKENDMITYLDGQDATSVEYSAGCGGGSYPGGLIIHVPDGRPAGYWDQVVEFNANCYISPAYGFVWDNTAVLNEQVACDNVISKYDTALQCGMLDPETTIPEFLAELEAAGVDKILAEKQAQFDAWLAEKGE